MHKRSVSFAASARAAVALAVLGSGAHSVLAQDNVTIDARQCQKLESPADRLECYERQVNAASPHTQSGAPATPAPQAPAPAAPPASAARSAAPPAAAATAAPVASAHATPATPPNASPAAPSAPATHSSAEKNSGSGNTTAPSEIVAKVTALSRTVPDAWLITLDNGQVWRQTYPQAYALTPGVQVTLRPSRWGGAFRLTGDGMNGYIQVEKVR